MSKKESCKRGRYRFGFVSHYHDWLKGEKYQRWFPTEASRDQAYLAHISHSEFDSLFSGCEKVER